MTKEELIEIAEQVYGKCDWHGDALAHLEQLAKLLVEKEREACAKIAENRMLDDKNENIKKGYFYAQQSIAQDIRTRKNT
jgi:hypothetical protein